jgi:hypothetical protein
MRKLFFSIAVVAATMITASAQETKVVKNETKVKKTSSIPQKVHNTFHKKKQYNGKKVKHTQVVEKTTTAQ